MMGGGFKMQSENLRGHPELDQEWVTLIICALEMGFTVKDIRTFFAESKLKLLEYH
jgi:hypothetical protein